MPTAKRPRLPDIDAEMSLANAAADDVDAFVSRSFSTRTFLNALRLNHTRASTSSSSEALPSFLFAKNHGCDKARLQMLRDYIDGPLPRRLSCSRPLSPPGARCLPQPRRPEAQPKTKASTSTTLFNPPYHP